MELEDYVRPVVTAVSTTFLTARAAARHMIRRGAGVILVFGGSGPPLRGYSLGGIQVAFEAMESMRRQLSSRPLQSCRSSHRSKTWATRRRSPPPTGVAR